MNVSGGRWRRWWRPPKKASRAQVIESLKHRNPTTYYFPNIPLTLLYTRKDYGPNKYAFKVRPQLTKLEIRDYVSQLYDCTVKKVNTMNYEAKYRRTRKATVRATRKVRGRYKKAIVTVDYTKETDDSVIIGAPTTL